MKKIHKSEYAILAYIGVISAVSFIPGEALSSVVSLNDKLLHMLMFGVLGFLAALSIRKYAVVWAVLIIVATAGLTEGFQRFVPGREADIWDFVSDVAGGILILCAGRIVRVQRLIKKDNKPV
ncbi:VanZ family protein [Planctomycetota bacterium]